MTERQVECVLIKIHKEVGISMSMIRKGKSLNRQNAFSSIVIHVITAFSRIPCT
jgi:hypothetical protein